MQLQIAYTYFQSLEIEEEIIKYQYEDVFEVMSIIIEWLVWSNGLKLGGSLGVFQKSTRKSTKINITIFVNLEIFRHFEIVTNMRTWIQLHKYWRLL